VRERRTERKEPDLNTRGIFLSIVDMPNNVGPNNSRSVCVLQCASVCVAVRCSALQSAVVRCRALQYMAQHNTVPCSIGIKGKSTGSADSNNRVG